MPLPGPIGLPCALNYTLNSASMCTFDSSTLESTNLLCPESSTLTGNKCIASCSASFVPNAALGCVADPILIPNYKVPTETTSCPSGKTLKRLGPAKGGGKVCVPSSYQPNVSVPFCPTGYIQSGNRCYKPCPSTSDPGSSPPLCYALYGNEYNPIASTSPNPNTASSSTSPPPTETSTTTTSITTLNSSDYVNDSDIYDNTVLVDESTTLISKIMVYKNQIMIALIVFFIIIGGIALSRRS
jgi:hypothetical protein